MNRHDLFEPIWGNLFLLPRRGQFGYFGGGTADPLARFPGAPEAAVPFVKAAFACDASMLAYERWADDPMPPGDFESILEGFSVRRLTTGEATGTAGYFAASPRFAYLVFRGTEHDDPRDFATDFAFVPVAEPRDPSVFHSFFVAGMRVHMGFQTAIDSVWPEVCELLKGYREAWPEAEICFTGHSLGAALATLAVSRFAGGRASLYTFGAPRVGNADFCRAVEARADLGIYRFVNQNDLVTHVPPEDFGYRHPAARMFHIEGDWSIREADAPALSDWRDLADFVESLSGRGYPLEAEDPAPPYLADHSPARYSVRLWNWLETLGVTSPGAARSGAAGEGAGLG